MELLTFLLVAAGVSAIAVLANRHAGKTAESWRATAAALGLGFDVGPHSTRYVHARRHLPEMYGPHDGQDVYVGVREYTTGTGKNRRSHHYTYVDVVFDVALKRGLQVGRADGISKFFADIFGQQDIQVGHAELDREYRIRGQHADQIVALLARAELARQLLADRAPFRASITDVQVRFEASGVHVTPEVLRPILPVAVALYRDVLRAWTELPPSAEEARVEPAWRSVCERAQLAYAARGMRGTGHVRDVDVRLELVLDDDRGWTTELQARFAPDLAVGFALTNQGALATVAKLLGAQDITVGDPAFDAQFVVKGKDGELVRQILSADARRGLLDLHARAGALVVTDAGVLVRIHRIVEDATELRALLDLVVDTGCHMVAHRKAQPGGVYR